MDGLSALLAFQFRSGARLAMRSFTPIFSLLLAAVMLQMEPVATVRMLARLAFAAKPDVGGVAMGAFLAFLLPAWAAPRLSAGLSGWLRHLPLSSRVRRLGIAAGLFTVQLPLLVSLALLGLVAHGGGMSILLPSVRWFVVCFAGAIAALPVQRAALSIPIGLAAGWLALFRGWDGIAAGSLLICAALGVAGRLRKVRSRRPREGATALFEARIAWRAIGWRTLHAYIPALLVWGAALLFIVNNQLTGRMADGAARFGSVFSIAALLAILADRLGARRPAWPWARSLPWSAARRVASDAAFLAAHAFPLLVLQLFAGPACAAAALAALPLLVLRGAGWLRRIPEARSGGAAFLGEGFAVAATAALVPWSAWLMPLAAIPAYFGAREADRAAKVTRWRELHHFAAGDSQSWEAR